MTERKTENLVRDALRELKYYDPDNGISIEEQKSEILKIKSLLSKASKNQKGNAGFPEFIITSNKDFKFCIIIECKANTNKHISKNLDDPVNYAVDGVLHYAKHLSKSYSVLAIAVSGLNESEMLVSTFIHPCESDSPKPLINEAGQVVKDILTFDDYYRLASFDPNVAAKRHSDLLAFSRELHELIWTRAKISEEDKPLLVSGTLIALMNSSFNKTFTNIDPEDLQTSWLEAIKKELEKADIPVSKKDTMLQPYTAIAVNPNLAKPDTVLAKEYPQGVFHAIISEINKNVWPYISIYHDFDVVGQFYGEFLKYTGGDKKALGIVLTPKHIAELFSLLADIKPTDKVLDICTGTGGFLISAMQHMLKQVMTEAERKDIKKNRLIGIENNPKMFALAASNMILRGDGKANLHQGSCFDDAIFDAVAKLNPTVGLINPPYAQSKSNAELDELYFVKRMLDSLDKGGTGVAIIPMSCAIAPSKARTEILKHHTLDAVMSMPDDLFYPVGVVTCIMVFKAGIPHVTTKTITLDTQPTDAKNKKPKTKTIETANKKTWFGFWKDDGFVKTKHLGRIDLNNKWPNIRDHWIEIYKNREVHPGESVTAYVTSEDEWCAEAYMDTDYTNLHQTDFEATLKKYAIHKLLTKINPSENEEDDSDDSTE